METLFIHGFGNDSSEVHIVGYREPAPDYKNRIYIDIYSARFYLNFELFINIRPPVS